MNLQDWSTYELVREVLEHFKESNGIEFLNNAQLNKLRHYIEAECLRRANGGIQP